MNLREYLATVARSVRSDWTVHTCWGKGSGPSYLQEIGVWNDGGGDFKNIEVNAHGMRASYNDDLNIWIAWGYTANPDFREEWANRFPDPNASSSYVDFFFGANLVFRDLYVTVDGGRCSVPLPKRDFDKHEKRVTRIYASSERINFFRILNQMESSIDYDKCIDMCGIEKDGAPWIG
jgi:hypothetical protein